MQTLGEALAALVIDIKLAKALGEEFVAEYLATKRQNDLIIAAA